MSRTIPEHHLVIGAGISGCVTAVLRAAVGYEVTVVDRATSASPDVYPVCTDTSTIVSENHSGAEYPFDFASGADCLDGRIANERFFPEVIYGGKRYSRIIASAAMSSGPEDIRQQCRVSLSRLREHYRRRVDEDPGNRVLGDPDDFFRESPGGPAGVLDACATFVTPQRGINPTYVAAVLELELRRLGVRFRQGATVNRVAPDASRRLRVSWKHEQDGVAEEAYDQVAVAAAVNGFHLAAPLDGGTPAQPIYLALRQILLVRLPASDSTSRDFTCLKLEHEHGGMFSPFNPHDVLVYYPPEAHIAVTTMPPDGRLPETYERAMARPDGESAERARRTIERASAFYPELEGATVAGVFHKIAINTVDDSRIRRNMGVVTVAPGCTLLALPKWTMAVQNGLRDVRLALAESVRRGHLSPAEAEDRASELARFSIATPDRRGVGLVQRRARHHATNMRLPVTLADSFLSPGLAEPPERRHAYVSGARRPDAQAHHQ